MGKRIVAKLYTQGKFGRRLRETLDTDNPCLCSRGRYPTKITADDLPEDYVEIHSRAIWHMTGYVKTAGIADLAYTWARGNHLFKDDYLYISYKEKLQSEVDRWGYKDYVNCDLCICGNDIPDLVLAAEKYSGVDTSAVRAEIEKKRVWLRDNEPEE